MSNLLLCVPDSLFDRIGTSVWSAKVPFGSDAATSRRAFFPTAFLLENGLDEATRRPIFSVSRNLVVRDDRTLVDPSNASSQSDEAKRPDQRLKGEGEPTISFRGRDLRYAILDRSDLHGADFTLADLSGASLIGANLKGATFGCAERKSSPLRTLWERLSNSKPAESWPYNAVCTLLTSASLAKADLSGAKFAEFGLWKPSLREVDLSGAILDFMDLSWANLNGADLSWASLKGIVLTKASLIGARLTGANLTGANLAEADLGLSALNHATLIGADLSHARLIAAQMTGIFLIGAYVTDTNFTAAQLRQAHVWLTDPPQKKNLAWADLTEIDAKEPSPSEKDWLNRSLQELDKGNTSTLFSVQRLQEYLRLGSVPADAKGGAAIWLEWAVALSRSENDPTYRTALDQILSDLGCGIPEYGAAIVRWTTSGTEYSYGTYDRDAVPEPPPDPSLEKIPDFQDPNIFSGGSSDVYPTVLNPISSPANLRSFLNALKGGRCAASEYLPTDTVLNLSAAIAERAKDRAAPVPK